MINQGAAFHSAELMVLTILSRRRYTARRMFISTRSSRIGLALFAIYLVFYGGFVLIAAFAPELMEATPLAGVNLAVWYGFGLISAALVLALIYGWTCRNNAETPTNTDKFGGGPT